MNSIRNTARFRRTTVRHGIVAGFLLLAATLQTFAQLVFPTFSGRVVSGPENAGLAGVRVSWTLSPNNGGASGGGGATTTDANGNYSGTFGAATEGNGFEWRFTFTKVNHIIDGFDRRIVGFSGNFVMPNPSVAFGPLTGRALSGTLGVPGVVVYPGEARQTDTTVTAGTIPNNSNAGVTSIRGYEEPGFIANLTVRPVITHPRAGDLVITLIHPDGTSVLLRRANSDSFAYNNPTYSVAGNNTAESLATLYGKTPTGTWKLVVSDPAGGSASTGTFVSWSLGITTTPVVTDAGGNFDAGFAKIFRATPTHPLVTSFASTFTDIPGGVPTTLRVNQGRIVGRIFPATTSLLLQRKVLAGIQLRAQQPPGNTGDTSWGILLPDVGTYDLATRTIDGVNFTQRLLSGSADTLVIPSGRGMTFSPASVTSYAGATNVNFTIVASPPAIDLPTSVTMTEDTTFFGIVTVADLEQPATALNITATYSDNPQLINSDGIVVTGPAGNGITRSLNLTPIPNQFGSATIFVVISDGTLFTTNSFPLTVTPVADTPTAGTTSALRLDGVDDYVVVSPGPVIPISGDFTVEAWAFLNPGATGAREILSQGTGGNAFYIGMANGVVRAGDTWLNPNNIPFPVGVWTHFTVVKSGSGAFLYTNGVLVASIGSGVANPVDTEFRIGRQYGGFGEYWAGRIDDVRVWNVARTESDIRRTMTVPLIGNEPGLRAYYRFDESSGIIAYDSAPSTSTQGGPQDGYLKSGASWVDNSGINGGLGIHRYTVDEETPTPIFLTGLDVDGRPITTNLTYTFDSLPQHGTLSRTGGSLHVLSENPIIYTPALNYIGADSFNYRVTDSTGLAKGATVSINVANVNDIPTISAIPDQLIIEDTTNVLAFVVNDSDANQVKTDLAVTVVFESGGTVPIQTNWVTTANGTNRTLYIVPAKGEIGNVVVTVTVRDTPGDSASSYLRASRHSEARLRRARHRHTPRLVDQLRQPPSTIRARSPATPAATPARKRRAFRFNGILDGSTLTDLGAASGTASYAYGINGNGEITGSVIEGGVLPQAFAYRNGTFTKLGFAEVGNRSEGRAINALGQIVGFGNVNANATNRALIYTNGVWGVLPSLIGTEVFEAFGINDAGQIAGRAVTNGALRAVLYTAGNRLVAPLIGGAVNNYANAINSAGAIAGAMTINGTAQAFRWEQGQNPVLLGGFIPTATASRMASTTSARPSGREQRRRHFARVPAQRRADV
jgi:subtilisin-like proprotein convertase family protein